MQMYKYLLSHQYKTSVVRSKNFSALNLQHLLVPCEFASDIISL